jgi:hypothetical protein
VPDTTKTFQIRKQILKDKGLVRITNQPKKLVTIDELPANFPKPPLMRLVELKSGQPIQEIVFSGTIYQVGYKYNIDPSTVSKWRKLISEANRRIV